MVLKPQITVDRIISIIDCKDGTISIFKALTILCVVIVVEIREPNHIISIAGVQVPPLGHQCGLDIIICHTCSFAQAKDSIFFIFLGSMSSRCWSSWGGRAVWSILYHEGLYGLFVCIIPTSHTTKSDSLM